MQSIDTFKRVVQYICGELIVLFVPRILSPLHLASFYEDSIKKDEKELLKLSKKMLRIATKFSFDDTEVDEKYPMDRNVKLFYEVYNKMEYLTLKELKLLYDFCSLLRKQEFFCIVKDNHAENEMNFYCQSCENIYDFIEIKKEKKKIVSRR